MDSSGVPTGSGAGELQGLSMSYEYLGALAGVFAVLNVALAIAVGRFIRFGMSEDNPNNAAPVKIQNAPDIARPMGPAKRPLRR